MKKIILHRNKTALLKQELNYRLKYPVKCEKDLYRKLNTCIYNYSRNFTRIIL